MRTTDRRASIARLPPSPYRGSPKHKNRPARGRKGTMCPEWTHAAQNRGLGNDVFEHPWIETVAHALFARAEESTSEPGRRFATERGIAFEAKSSADGTWHGHPVPWEEVPDDLVDRWRAMGVVSGRDLQRYLSKAKSDYRWPLESDDD